jgi:hypothetical protein
MWLVEQFYSSHPSMSSADMEAALDTESSWVYMLPSDFIFTGVVLTLDFFALERFVRGGVWETEEVGAGINSGRSCWGFVCSVIIPSSALSCILIIAISCFMLSCSSFVAKGLGGDLVSKIFNLVLNLMEFSLKL